jgi:hypothetical protein
VPTTRPRYTFTDTGSVQGLLDEAERRWPDVRSRKELLLRLAQAGQDSLRRSDADAEARHSHKRQTAALAALQGGVDWDAIRDDQAWR